MLVRISTCILYSLIPLAGLAKDDASLHCPHAGPEGGQVCGGVCETFCSRLKEFCPGQYMGDTCIDTCNAWPDGEAGDTSGNSKSCRINSINSAAADVQGKGAIACPNAGNSSATCSDGSPCQKHCNLLQAECGEFGGTLNTYKTEKDCLAACSYFPTNAAIGVLSGNSLQCRNTHVRDTARCCAREYLLTCRLRRPCLCRPNWTPT